MPSSPFEKGKVQYFTACTLDGFIADENNSLDWLFEVPHDADDEYWDQWFPDVGGLVMGATTYEWMLDRYGLADSTERWREFYPPRLECRRLEQTKTGGIDG